MTWLVALFATNPNGPISSVTASGIGDIITIGGYFTGVASSTRNFIAMLNADASVFTQFNPQPGANNYVSAVAVRSWNEVYLAGVFTSVNGHSERYLASFRSNGTLGDWALHPDQGRWVEDIAQHDGMIVLAEAGQGGRVQVFNTSGHELWRVFCNGDVQAVSIADKKVIVGGHFLTVDLKPAPRLAALTFQGNLVTTWHPLPDKPVWTIRGSAKNVYVGGEFSKIQLGGTTIGTAHFAEFQVS